jgi:OmpA-OmpF porin, OOP family
MLHRPAVFALLVMALSAANVWAGDVKVFGAAERVDPAEVASILGRRPAAKAIKMRSLRLIDDATAAAGEAANEPAKESALALPVNFRFDSAEILADAKPQLDAIAAGIRLLPATQHVIIEGHTDARGTEQYNEALSIRRAHSVQRYLVAVHGIEPSRLRAVGFGERATLEGTDPFDAANRRVQFRGE